MKAAICAVAIGIGWTASAWAQGMIAPPEPPTRLQAFLAQEGAVIIRASSRIGAVRGEPGSLVAVASKEFTNASTGERAYGITVEVRKVDPRESGGTSYVDLEEIASLLGGLEYMAKVENSVTQFDQFELAYRTKGGLLVTAYNTSNGMKAVVSSSLVGAATAELEYADFLKFRQLLQGAYDGLRTIAGGEQ